MDILESLVYPKIGEMIDRKQEKRRRIRGMELMCDLMKTQRGSVIISSSHKKYFHILSEDSNFIYRAEMAACLGNIMKSQEDENLSDISFSEIQMSVNRENENPGDGAETEHFIEVKH